MHEELRLLAQRQYSGGRADPCSVSLAGRGQPRQVGSRGQGPALPPLY